MKTKEILLYLDFAQRISQLSHAERLKVGAVIARENGIILSYGYNGTPTGVSNICETYTGKTKPEVIHAEANAILKCAKEGISTQGATLFLTHSPCMECAKLILQCGIKEVYFLNHYTTDGGQGMEFLNYNSILTYHYGK